MDLTKSEKLKAKRKSNNLIQSILIHSLTSLTCVLLCFYRFWIPQLISSAESFVFASLLQWKPFLVNAKTMFLVANLIVIFLVGDSEFRWAAKNSSSSLVADLYDEYVERSKSLRGMHANGVEESNEKEEKEERAQKDRPEPAKDEGEQNSGRGVEFKELPTEELTRSTTKDLQDPKSDEGGESDELPNEELTRRAEEFIARVNKRRWLESRSIIPGI